MGRVVHTRAGAGSGWFCGVVDGAGVVDMGSWYNTIAHVNNCKHQPQHHKSRPKHSLPNQVAAHNPNLWVLGFAQNKNSL